MVDARPRHPARRAVLKGAALGAAAGSWGAGAPPP